MGWQRVRHDWATELGLDAMILVFWMLSFRPTFSLSSFTFIKRLFSSSLLSAIRVVSSACLRLLIFLPATLIPACASSSPAFLMMYSACKLNKQGDSPWDFPGMNSGVGCHTLLQGIFPIQRSNPGLCIVDRCFTVWATREAKRREKDQDEGSLNISPQSESESEVAQSCLTLCDPTDCSPPGSSVHGIFQARILKWVAISFSRKSSQPRDWTQVSRIVGRHFTIWATREVFWLFKTVSHCVSFLYYMLFNF